MVKIGKDTVVVMKDSSETEKSWTWTPAVLSILIMLGGLTLVSVIAYYSAGCSIASPGKLSSVRCVTKKITVLYNNVGLTLILCNRHFGRYETPG